MILNQKRYHDDMPINDEVYNRRWPTDDQFDGDPDYPMVPFDPMYLPQLLDADAAKINSIDPYTDDLQLQQDIIRTLMQRREIDI